MFRILVMAGVLLVSVSGKASAGILWAVDFEANAFVSIDKSDASTTTIGTSSVQYTGLALNQNTGVLYARDLGNLYTLNPSNGVPTLVGSNGVLPGLTNLAFNNDFSTLYSTRWGPADGSGLYSIDTSDGSATLIGANTTNFLGGFAITSLNQAFAADSFNAKRLYTMDLSNGTLTTIATMADGITSMTFDENDNLFGVTLTDDDFVQINTTTGAFTTIGTMPPDFVDVNGLTVIPEPPTVALPALGFIGFVAWGWRQRWDVSGAGPGHRASSRRRAQQAG